MKKFIIIPILLLSTALFAQTESKTIEEVNEPEKIVEENKVEELTLKEKFMMFLNKGNYIYFSSTDYFVTKHAINFIDINRGTISFTTRMPRLDEEIYLSYQSVELDEFCNLIITEK